MISYFDFLEVSTCLLLRLALSKSHFGPQNLSIRAHFGACAVDYSGIFRTEIY